MVSKRGLSIIESMNMLWEYGWVKLNDQWKDPDTGMCFYLEPAVNRCLKHQEETERKLNEIGI